MAGADSPWLHESYLARRKVFKFFGGAFHIYNPRDEVVFYGEQKAFRLKEDMRVYSGEDKRQEILRIAARGIFDFGMTYDIHDTLAGGEHVGAVARRGIKSMLRDEWEILDPEDRPLGTCKEDSLAKAIFRRFLSNLVPQAYNIEADGQPAAEFRQYFNPFVFKMQLDFSMDPEHKLDRRLSLGLAICLLAIEGRQE